MPTVFADSFYFFALGNRNDPAHGKALEFFQSFSGRVVTTRFVLMEFADGCCSTVAGRQIASKVIRLLGSNPAIRVLPCSEYLFNDGLDLYDRRADKEWSLTDCISFVVMEREGIQDALTGDKHFEQAGFTALLK